MGRTVEKTHPWLDFGFDARLMTPTMWIHLGEARSKCEHIAGAPLLPETARRLHEIYLVKGIQGTTAIEGNSLTEDQVHQAIEGRLELPPSKSYLQQEVTNILKALRGIIDSCMGGSLVLINPTSISAFNMLVLDELQVEEHIRPGTLRTYPVGVGRYKAPEAKDCPKLFDDMCTFLERFHNETCEVYGVGSAILRAILAHAYFALIHPFGDGNGRTARLLEFAILLNAGIPTPAALLLSNYYNETRALYYHSLNQISTGGTIMVFVDYALKGLVEGLQGQIDMIREQQLEVAWRDHVHSTFSKQRQTAASSRQKTLVLALSKTPEPVPRRALTTLTPQVAVLYANKTPKTLSRDLNQLSKLGLAGPRLGGYKARTELAEAFLPDRAPTAEFNIEGPGKPKGRSRRD